MPPRVEAQIQAACARLDGIAGAPPDAARRAFSRTATRWKRAHRLVAKLARARRVDSFCADALGTTLAEARERARAAARAAGRGPDAG